MPHWPFKNQWIDMYAGSAGVAHGRMKMTNSPLTHHLFRMKKPDSMKARNIFRFTPMPT